MRDEPSETFSASATLKRIAGAIAFVIALPAIVAVRLWSWGGTDTPFISFGCLFSLVPGKIGSFLRAGYYMGTLAGMSPESQIGFGSFFSKRSARVGRNVRIGAYCIIGSAEIADDVIIASRVSITSGRHQHGGGKDGPHQRESRFDQVTIGAGAWIGEGAIVMAPVGAGCIVGAGSVVVKPAPDGAVVYGLGAAARVS